MIVEGITESLKPSHVHSSRETGGSEWFGKPKQRWARESLTTESDEAVPRLRGTKKVKRLKERPRPRRSMVLDSDEDEESVAKRKSCRRVLISDDEEEARRQNHGSRSRRRGQDKVSTPCKK